MTRCGRLLALVALAMLLVVAPAHAADGITKGTIYKDAPDNRYLVGGTWLFRLDKAGVGLKDHYQRQTGTAGWANTTVPNAWNATDESVASMAGTVGWYRKDFHLPSSSAHFDWLVRFESVNYRSEAWLNGKPIGRNTGAYLPFTFRLPPGILKRHGTNHLVVRVDNRRKPYDFPPSGLTAEGVPTGGWWNYGGILREVYLQRIDTVDFSSVRVRPDLPCRTCAATVDFRVTVRNYSAKARRVRVNATFGGRRVRLGTRTVGAKQFSVFGAGIRIAHPSLWEPGHPALYPVHIDVFTGGRRRVSYALHTGIRSITIADGRLMLNGRAVNFRGVGLHEDDPKLGAALDSARRRQLMYEVQDLGATLVRAHYPLHPEMYELADRLGILMWSEIPVYALKTPELKRLETRKLAARMLQENIVANQNHASIGMWSIGNELSSRPGPVQGYYISRAAREAKALDPTRPVGLAVAGYPSAGCQSEYGPLDILGINDYFGWYPGPNGQIADRDALSDYLDSVRACYPHKAIVVTEFGAEANRSGPVEEKGTFEFQDDFINYHLGVYATKPWLSGAIYWALEEFRVRPGWDGGNPRPDPPLHQKGLIAFDGTKKPAWYEVQHLYKGTQQYGPARK